MTSRSEAFGFVAITRILVYMYNHVKMHVLCMRVWFCIMLFCNTCLYFVQSISFLHNFIIAIDSDMYHVSSP